ncbi:hypothetical protein C6P46_003390 [Rhodotorula mucilaginosa]|uniref:Uncharacterized protein n=1 Tax=Rhodotorula mucilaginosa TaxID=5537 RepID=A0A9P7B1D1_RHOMI|nr:hypothetical protein C6P46_003390 [Rhodotorula mucilaginosa]
MATPTNANAPAAASSAPAGTLDMCNAANVDRYLDYFTDVEDGKRSVTLYTKFYGGAYRYVQGGTYGHTAQAPKLVEFALERTFGKTADWSKLPDRSHEDHVNRQREFEQRRSNKTHKIKSGGGPNKPANDTAGAQGRQPRAVTDVTLKQEYNKGWADGTRDGRKAALDELKIPAEIADAYRRAMDYFSTGGACPEYHYEVPGAMVVFIRTSEFDNWSRCWVGVPTFASLGIVFPF